MKRFLALMALLAVVAFAVNAKAESLTSSKLEGWKIAATDANTSTTVGASPGGSTTSLTIYNASMANEIFVEIDAAATASSVEVPAGASVALDNFTAKSVGIICSTGETATVYIYATYR